MWLFKRLLCTKNSNRGLGCDQTRDLECFLCDHAALVREKEYAWELQLFRLLTNELILVIENLVYKPTLEGFISIHTRE